MRINDWLNLNLNRVGICGEDGAQKPLDYEDAGLEKLINQPNKQGV